MYPPIHPFEQAWLPVGDGHEVYFEQSGNPRGVPVVFLHGGPGSRSRPHHRQYFDPSFFRIVLLDQRGCGHSRPSGAIAHNSTTHLLHDLELLRLRLGIEAWLVFGGSWGSTLALAYSIAHPQCVTGLILRGVFLASRAEVDWFLVGLQAFIPEAWNKFTGGNPHGILGRYLRELDHNGATPISAARRWSDYESASMAMSEDSPSSVAPAHDDAETLARVRVQTHYLANDCFLAPDELISGLGKIAHLPAEIVQGRLDMICPPATARRVSAGLPRSRLNIVGGAGHSATHPLLAGQLVAASNRFRALLGGSA